jgi:hypothetical protein
MRVFGVCAEMHEDLSYVQSTNKRLFGSVRVNGSCQKRKDTGRKTDKINLGPGHKTERGKLYFYFGGKAFYFVYILCIFSSRCNKRFAYNCGVLWEGKINK